MTIEQDSQSVKDEQEQRERRLTDKVVASFAKTPDARLLTLLTSLTEHLHTFIREVRLTESEWKSAIDFLTEVGHITDDKRQEFILLSDVLGASMQTVTVNNEAVAGETESTVFGPFFVDNSPEIVQGDDISGGAPGQPCWVEGTVTDIDGTPIPQARIEVWEADDDGFYDVQYSDGRTACRAHIYSDTEGRFQFWGLTPTPYPIPHDGPVGKMLEAVGRSPMRASHLHFMVAAERYRTLITHIFVRGDELLNHDSVFGVKDSLIRDFVEQPVGTITPNGRDLTGTTWSRVVFDIILAPED